MNTSEAIRARRSIRKYKKGTVIPKEHIHQMLEAAMMAPSACNTRPWEFVVVETEEIREQIMKSHPYTQMLKTASLAIVVCGRPDLQESVCAGFWPPRTAALLFRTCFFRQKNWVTAPAGAAAIRLWNV